MRFDHTVKKDTRSTERESLSLILGKDHRAQWRMSVDEVQGLMLQISFAIMMVFMIAYFMFKTESEREKEEQLLEIERQKLVLAADSVLDMFRARYGLNILLPSPGGGERGFDAGLVMDGNKLTEVPLILGAFSNGAENGADDFSDVLELRRRWTDMVIEEAGVEKGSLASSNADWLSGRVDSDIAGAEEDLRTVQNGCVAALQRYWTSNPGSINDPAVSELLKKFNAASEEGRLLLVTELSQALRKYGFSELSRLSGAEMLP